jgi:hypothetical protein
VLDAYPYKYLPNKFMRVLRKVRLWALASRTDLKSLDENLSDPLQLC